MNNAPPIPTNINIQELIKKGEDIYNQELKSSLEPMDNNRYVAIEVDTHKYFVGNTKEEAISNARIEFKDKVFFVRKIGTIEQFTHYHAESSYKHDWLF